MPAEEMLNRESRLEAHSFYTACPVCSDPPYAYRFNSHAIDEITDLIEDAATTTCQRMDVSSGSLAVAEHKYLVRDGVLMALQRPGHSSDDMLWAFVASSERQGLVGLRIGDVVQIVFDEPFDDVFAVTLYQIPHREARSDYGSYRVHWVVDQLTVSGFVLVSSYFADSPRTSESAFLVGWRAFGRMASDPEQPLWRQMLANAHQHLLLERWYLALLEAAFALEAFVDSMASAELIARDVPDFLVSEMLREDDFETTLRSVAGMRGYPQVSRSQIKRLAEKLGIEVRTPRNRLAHGSFRPADISESIARRAVGRVQETIWDWNPEARPWLLLVNRDRDLCELRDSS